MTLDNLKPLLTNEIEQARFAELEQVIEEGFLKAADNFRKAAHCLKEIRDQRLYKQTHRSFETYCQERWGFTRRRADQLIQFADDREKMRTMVLTSGLEPPKTEREARRRRAAGKRGLTVDEVNAMAADPNRVWKWEGLVTYDAKDEDAVQPVIITFETKEERERLLRIFSINLAGSRLLKDGTFETLELDLPLKIKARYSRTKPDTKNENAP